MYDNGQDDKTLVSEYEDRDSTQHAYDSRCHIAAGSPMILPKTRSSSPIQRNHSASPVSEAVDGHCPTDGPLDDSAYPTGPMDYPLLQGRAVNPAFLPPAEHIDPSDLSQPPSDAPHKSTVTLFDVKGMLKVCSV